MNTKIKEFFKNAKRGNGGFTLVELIITIAIVAILGGVAVPAYTGYIAKADAAADAQLLGDINKAFAAACMVEGIDNYGAQSASASLTEEKTVEKVIINGEDITATFDKFYEGGAFKKTAKLEYVPGEGRFVDPEADGKTKIFAFGNGFVQVTSEAIQALLNSTFYGEGMTSEKLLTQVDNVAAVAGLMGTVQNVMQTEGYVNAALASLGITPSADPAENAALLNQKAQELALKKMGLTDISQITEANKAEYGEHLKNISNNALVLYTAQSTSAMGTEAAKQMLNGVNSGMIKDAMDGKLDAVDKATGMNQAALAYGMYYAYVNSDACTDPSIKGKSDIGALDVIAALDSGENSEFRTYMNSEQGTKDMEAYLQALSVINSSAQSPEAVEKLVVEGFASEDLVSILTQSMGK